MAFIDEVTLSVQSGKGGDGVVRWLRTKQKARGGPSGGDGGKGGDVIAVGVRDLAILAQYRHDRQFKAENGGDGSGSLKHGARGKDVRVKVPVGTSIELETGEIHEISEEGQEIVLYRGGIGGYGNAHFKSSTNQNPFERTVGKPAMGGEVKLVLKIIADVGLVGLPNAGKSSLINALTRSKSKVGEYPFTTLEPHLGDLHGYILADIPGLIEGASSGRGLGTRFLRHIEKTRYIIHLVSSEQEDPVIAYNEIRKELDAFGAHLGEKKEVILLTKTDLFEEGEVKEKKERLKRATQREVLEMSTHSPALVKAFSDHLTQLLAS